MRVDGTYGGALSYEPNSYGEWQEQPDFTEPPLAINGEAHNFDFREDDHDYYSQPGNLFRMFSAEECGVARRFSTVVRNLDDQNVTVPAVA
jgi:catalase